jgi:hypothetical protein
LAILSPSASGDGGGVVDDDDDDDGASPRAAARRADAAWPDSARLLPVDFQASFHRGARLIDRPPGRLQDGDEAGKRVE